MQFSISDQVLNFYTNLGKPLSVSPVAMGLINKTYVVTSDKMKFIVQEVSSIFDTTINEDSEAVCRHLERHKILSPKIYRTDSSDLFLSLDGRIFRALFYIDGHSTHTIKSEKMAQSAGRVVGQFHKALFDFDYNYQSKRRHGGDYSFHRENLISTLKIHQDHDYFAQVEIFAQQMLAKMDSLIANFTTTLRHAHGDPKISNIIFDENDEAICLVDFDTLGKTGWSLELGDALRSWCNPHREDILDAHVDLAIAENALIGYGSVMEGQISAKEKNEIVINCQAITLCLAMRYLADVLNEKYFMFDKDRFSRPAEHNLLRAQSMFNLFVDFSMKKHHIASMVRDILNL